MSKAVFLDRDGLINKQALPHQYIVTWQEFNFLPRVPEAIKMLNDAGYLTLIVTNQRGVARGIMTMKDVDDIHQYMCDELEKIGAHIDGIYVCPHNYGQCHCRKPDIGLFLQAEEDFNIDKSKSWMVGDSESDFESGQRYGVNTIRTENLYEAVQRILKEDSDESANNRRRGIYRQPYEQVVQ